MIIDVPASELKLGDDLGEGMVIWMIAGSSCDDLSITVWWASRPVGMLTATGEDLMRNLNAYDPDDIVRVMRRTD